MILNESGVMVNPLTADYCKIFKYLVKRERFNCMNLELKKIKAGGIYIVLFWSSLIDLNQCEAAFNYIKSV